MSKIQEQIQPIKQTLAILIQLNANCFVLFLCTTRSDGESCKSHPQAAVPVTSSKSQCLKSAKQRLDCLVLLKKQNKTRLYWIFWDNSHCTGMFGGEKRKKEATPWNWSQFWVSLTTGITKNCIFWKNKFCKISQILESNWIHSFSQKKKEKKGTLLQQDSY